VVCLALLGAGVGAGVNSVLASFVAPEASDMPDVADGARPSLPLDGGPLVQQNSKRPIPQLKGKTEQEYLDAILCRNVFDPAAIESCKERSSGPVDDGSNSDLPVQLVGTMVASPATYSVAFITRDDTAAGSYGIDDKLLDATIIAIESERVAVRRGNGKQEYLTMVEGEVSKPPARSARGNDDEDEDVVKLGDNKFQVSREMIDKYMNDMEALSKMGRALLHRGPDGQFDGYRLSAIRRNTLADKLGIKNGDVIHSVNGKSLNSMSAAMDAYQTLTSENEFSFEVTRRGEKLSLGYDVQ
jgi:type II secretion system protein C